MSKRRIFAIIGLVFAFTGILLMIVSIFCQAADPSLLHTGLACTFIAFIFTFILNRKTPQAEENDQESAQ